MLSLLFCKKSYAIHGQIMQIRNDTGLQMVGYLPDGYGSSNGISLLGSSPELFDYIMDSAGKRITLEFDSKTHQLARAFIGRKLVVNRRQSL